MLSVIVVSGCGSEDDCCCFGGSGGPNGADSGVGILGSVRGDCHGGVLVKVRGDRQINGDGSGSVGDSDSNESSGSGGSGDTAVYRCLC